MGLHAGLCYLDKTCTSTEECNEHYNVKVNNAIRWIQEQQETYFITEENGGITSYILVEKGKFYGMGVLTDNNITTLEALKDRLTPYPENEVIRSMLSTFVSKYPHKVKRFDTNASA